VARDLNARLILIGDPKSSTRRLPGTANMLKVLHEYGACPWWN